MTKATSAQTQTVQANGITYGYRRFGRPDTVPVVCLQHFRGNMENWDPMLIDGIAFAREVILVNYPGAASSTGTPARTAAECARQLTTFLDALGLTTIDLFGYSIGGFMAQEIALTRPHVVRRLVLAGTGPQGAIGMHQWPKDIFDTARDPEFTAENVLHIFFRATPASQASGQEYLGRFIARETGRDPLTSLELRDAQYDLVVDWGIPEHGKLERLTGINMPTLILQGDDDRMFPPKLSYLLAGLIPDARVKIFPDSAHGSIFQYPQEAAEEINRHLSAN